MVKSIKYILPLFLLSLSSVLYGQQVPYYATSYRIFSPAVFNPAITGSIDYARITFTANVNGSHEAQILNGDGRLLKSKNKRWQATDVVSYSNFGVGGYAFHDQGDSLINFGAAASFSYHIPITQDGLSFLSVGLSGKGIYSKHITNAEHPDTATNHKDIFTPDLDFGLYFYSAHFYAGISTTNILSNPQNSGFPPELINTLSRQYFLTTGYKIILSRRRAILLEPSILMNIGLSSTDQSSLHYHPALKLYYKNSYIGSYLNNLDNMSFFLHVQTPWFYVGTYVEFPWSGDIIWYNGNLNLELSIGIILGRKHAQVPVYKYW